MARWYTVPKHTLVHKGFVFEYDTAYELGELVQNSGCNMENPYDPGNTDWDNFNDGKRKCKVTHNG